MVRTDRRIRICLALILANLALIWGNSLLPGEESGEMSGFFMEFLLNLLNLPATAAEPLHHLIRKAAHFTEFACLAMELTWLAGMLGETGFHLAALPLAGGMFTALTDESIQLLTPDRGPSLQDVWLDTAGALAGMMIVIFGYHLLKRKKRN